MKLTRHPGGICLFLIMAVSFSGIAYAADDDGGTTVTAKSQSEYKHALRTDIFPIVDEDGNTIHAKGYCLAMSLMTAHEMNCDFYYQSVDQEVAIKRKFILEAIANDLIDEVGGRIRNNLEYLKLYDEKVIGNQELTISPSAIHREIVAVGNVSTKGTKGEYAIRRFKIKQGQTRIPHWAVIWDSLGNSFQGAPDKDVRYIYYGQ